MASRVGHDRRYSEKIDSTMSAGTINTMLITWEMKMSVPRRRTRRGRRAAYRASVAMIAARKPIRNE